MKNCSVLIGSGAVGLASARKFCLSQQLPLLIADLSEDRANEAAENLRKEGLQVQAASVDVTSRKSIQELISLAKKQGEIAHLIHAAGVAPSKSSPELILKVDLYGTALVLELFGYSISQGGSGVVISSHAGHRLKALTEENNQLLANTPTDRLLSLSILQPHNIQDSMHAYMLAKKGCSLRVMADSLNWGKRGARLNTLSPGVIQSPLGADEISGPMGDTYKEMIQNCPVGRMATVEEIAEAAVFLLSSQSSFITGSDLLIDGGVTANHWFGRI